MIAVGMSRDPLMQVMPRMRQAPDRRRAAQLALANFALDQPDPQDWLRDMLDILGLHTPPGVCVRCRQTVPPHRRQLPGDAALFCCQTCHS